MAIAMPKTVPARKPPAGHYDPCCEELAARISGGNAGDGSAEPKPKIAKAERREARVPPLRDAGRFASARRAASWHANRVPKHPGACRRSAHPSLGVSEGRSQTPGANAPRERKVLTDLGRATLHRETRARILAERTQPI